MRQEGKAGLSASQCPNRRGNRKGDPSRGKRKIWIPPSRGSRPAWAPCWRGSHCPPGKRIVVGAEESLASPDQLPLQRAATLDNFFGGHTIL